MGDTTLFSSVLYPWVILPLLIFLARILDVSIGTVRLVFVSRGLKYLAPVAGFFEVLVWILALGQIMKNLSNPACYIGYAGGFAMGNFVGIWIAEKLSIGVVMVRVITEKEAGALIASLKEENYGVTSVDGYGTVGRVKVIFTIVPRREVQRVVELIKKFNPRAFYSVEEVGSVEKGVFPPRNSKSAAKWMGRLGGLWPIRKGE